MNLRGTLSVSGIMIFFSVLASSCADKTPARIELEPPPPQVLSSDPVNLNARIVNQKGDLLPEVPLTASAIPTEVLEVTQNGLASCKSSGDAVVTFAGGGLSAVANVKCRLVEKISLKLPELIVLDDGPIMVSAAALDSKGKTLEDVSISLASSSRDVASVAEMSVVPQSVGRVTITAEAGRIKQSAELAIAQRIVTDGLSLGDGESQSRTLTKGNYLVDINVASSDGSDYGVTLSWTGASCEGRAESRKHRITCSVQETASLIVHNPTTFGMGPSAMGNISIMRMP